MIPPPNGILDAALKAILSGHGNLSRPSTDQVDSIAKSPFTADTLKEVIGHYYLPKSIYANSGFNPGVYGSTSMASKDIEINTNPKSTQWGAGARTPAANRDLISTLLHEIGHVVPQEMEKQFPAYSSVNRPNLYFQSNGLYNHPPTVRRVGSNFQDELLRLTEGLGLTLPGNAKKTSPAEKKAFAALDPYYSGNDGKTRSHTDFGSGFGESFAQAFVNAMQYIRENGQKLQDNYRERAGQLEGNTPGMGQLVSDILGKDIFSSHPLRKVYNVPAKDKKK